MMTKTRHGTTNYRSLLPFLDGMGEADSHRTYEAGAYMPLHIEYLYCSDCKGRPVYSICHYGKQNGDLMRDPEHYRR